jgi:hypothetical protein
MFADLLSEFTASIFIGELTFQSQKVESNIPRKLSELHGIAL